MRPKRFILDTSLILALLNPRDVLHKQAKDLLFSIEDDTISFEIPLVCAIETLIKNPYPKACATLLAELINNRDFELTTTTDLEYISRLPIKIRTVLKANDCSIIAICNRLKAPLLTLDKRLEKITKTI